MLLLFASCLNCYVHGAFLFCGESCLIFIVKYKAVSFRIWEDGHFRATWKKNQWFIVLTFRESQKIVMFGVGVLCTGEVLSLLNKDFIPTRMFSTWNVRLVVVVLAVRLGFVFVYEQKNFNQIYLFLVEKKYIYSQLLLRMKSVEGESGRTNDVYCHTEKGNLIFFCIMYFWLAYISVCSADPADKYQFFLDEQIVNFRSLLKWCIQCFVSMWDNCFIGMSFLKKRIKQ